MSLKQYLILIGLGSIIAWITWIIVVVFTNPFEAGWLGFLMFYVTTAIALVGTLALIGFVVRKVIYRHDAMVLRQVTTAFRQAILLTLVLVGSLLLQSQSLLAWWNVLLFVVVVTAIEFFFLSSRFSHQ